MPTGVVQVRLAEAAIQRHRAILVDEVLGVGERQVEEQPQRFLDLPVQAGCQRPVRPAPGQGVAGIHARGAAEGVARILVEQHQQAEMCLGVCVARPQALGAGQFMGLGEAQAEAPVEAGVLGEPEAGAGLAPENGDFR